MRQYPSNSINDKAQNSQCDDERLEIEAVLRVSNGWCPIVLDRPAMEQDSENGGTAYNDCGDRAAVSYKSGSTTVSQPARHTCL